MSRDFVWFSLRLFSDTDFNIIFKNYSDETRYTLLRIRNRSMIYFYEITYRGVRMGLIRRSMSFERLYESRNSLYSYKPNRAFICIKKKK